MKVFVRVDSSFEIGTGHVMRCLTLAHALSRKGCQVSFICRELPGNICSVIENNGFKIYRLPPPGRCLPEFGESDLYAGWLSVDKQIDAQQTWQILHDENEVAWLVSDHYALDASWEKCMRPVARRIMVIDDIANRPHDCDLLLDQNLYEEMESRYEELVPEGCKMFLGPRYALLRQEFIEARKLLRERDGSVRRIMIFFGGSDLSNETTKAIEAWRLVGRPDIAVDVIVGAANPHREKVRQLCAELSNVAFYLNVNNMAQMMAEVDLAIGGGGSTTWERCFLGLPSITVILAENQAETTEVVARRGATLNLGWHPDVEITALASAIKCAISDPVALKEMSHSAERIMGAKDFVEDLLSDLMGES